MAEAPRPRGKWGDLLSSQNELMDGITKDTKHVDGNRPWNYFKSTAKYLNNESRWKQFEEQHRILLEQATADEKNHKYFTDNKFFIMKAMTERIRTQILIWHPDVLNGSTLVPADANLNDSLSDASSMQGSPVGQRYAGVIPRVHPKFSLATPRLGRLFGGYVEDKPPTSAQAQAAVPKKPSQEEPSQLREETTALLGTSTPAIAPANNLWKLMLNIDGSKKHMKIKNEQVSEENRHLREVLRLSPVRGKNSKRTRDLMESGGAPKRSRSVSESDSAAASSHHSTPYESQFPPLRAVSADLFSESQKQLERHDQFPSAPPLSHTDLEKTYRKNFQKFHDPQTDRKGEERTSEENNANEMDENEFVTAYVTFMDGTPVLPTSSAPPQSINNHPAAFSQSTSASHISRSTNSTNRHLLHTSTSGIQQTRPVSRQENENDLIQFIPNHSSGGVQSHPDTRDRHVHISPAVLGRYIPLRNKSQPNVEELRERRGKIPNVLSQNFHVAQPPSQVEAQQSAVSYLNQVQNQQPCKMSQSRPVNRQHAAQQQQSQLRQREVSRKEFYNTQHQQQHPSPYPPLVTNASNYSGNIADVSWQVIEESLNTIIQPLLELNHHLLDSMVRQNAVKTKTMKKQLSIQLISTRATLDMLRATQTKMQNDIPRVHLQKFIGDTKDYPIFKQMFEQTYAGQTDDLKYTHLRSLLQNEPYEHIKYIMPGPGAYYEMWNALDKHYKSKYLPGADSLNEAHQLPEPQPNDWNALNKFYMGAKRIYYTMKSNGITPVSNQTLHITLKQKLDPITRHTYNEHQPYFNPEQDTSKLIEFLFNRLEAYGFKINHHNK